MKKMKKHWYQKRDVRDILSCAEGAGGFIAIEGVIGGNPQLFLIPAGMMLGGYAGYKGLMKYAEIQEKKKAKKLGKVV
jgi:hypothetical protein